MLVSRWLLCSGTGNRNAADRPDDHPPTSRGQTNREDSARRTFSLHILAVRKPAGEMIVGVGADYRLSAKDVLIVLAKPENLERFRKHHGLGSRADVEHRL